MASGMKSLAKDTAIYGLSSILGRFINWGLVPIYTRVLTTGEFGIVTNVYGYTALFMVILTYGMETGFFRFINKEEKPMTVYSTTLISIGFTSLLFILLCTLNAGSIANFLEYGNHADYILIMATVVAVDAFMSIPFAYLRYKKRPLRFAFLRLTSILATVLFTIFFLVICPSIHKTNPSLIDWFYNPHYKEGYVFVANMIGTGLTLLLLLPELIGFKYVLDKELLRRMLRYSLPLLVLGVAGILNQTIDKILYPFLFDDKATAMSQLGIYGACSRVAVVMMMFTQAFRFAYEPFIFGKSKEDSENHRPYIEAMKYFIIFSIIVFLGVMFYIDILKYFVGEDFFEGMNVVPIVMLGYVFFGIYFNLSFWYKLVDKTYFGAIFSILGLVVTVLINILFVPTYGYIASAWASLICNVLMMMLSYIFEQKYHPIKYDLKTIGFYSLLATILYVVAMYTPIEILWLRLLFRTVILAIFLAVVVKKDLPLSEIPFINKWAKKKAN